MECLRGQDHRARFSRRKREPRTRLTPSGKNSLTALLPDDENARRWAEAIIFTGTSGGGGLTAAVIASGDDPAFLPFLDAAGAAGVTDDNGTLSSTLDDPVFAAVAYCPINKLGNADAGYEWQHNAIRDDSNTGALDGLACSAGPQPAASAAIAATFPDYLAGLGMTLDDGSALNSDNMNAVITDELKAEVERQIAAGTAVPNLGEDFTVVQRGVTSTITNQWLTLTGSGTSATVANIDFEKFLQFVTTPIALKTVVAFDATGVTGNPSVSGESTLFGTAGYEYSNFSAWSWNNNEVLADGTGTDDTGLSWSDFIASDDGAALATQLKLINPIQLLQEDDHVPAPHWYVRHGMIDRDTAFAMQLTLVYALKNDAAIEDVNFKVPYLTPHSGNYDVQEAFSWISSTLAADPL